MVALSIFSIIFSICLMCIIAPFTQWNLYEINPDLFRRVKIKKLSFLFKTIGGKNSVYSDKQKYGIPIPLFVLQAAGYIIAVISTVTVLLLCLVFDIQLVIAAIITYIIIGSHVISIIVVELITMLISKKRENKYKCDNYKINNYVDQQKKKK